MENEIFFITKAKGNLFVSADLDLILFRWQHDFSQFTEIDRYNLHDYTHVGNDGNYCEQLNI